MKHLVVSLAAAVVLTGCIALPSLSPENEKLATDVSTFMCMADKQGLLKENAELTPAMIEDVLAQLKAKGTEITTIDPATIETQLNTIAEDPIQLGLFLKTLVEKMAACGAEPKA